MDLEWNDNSDKYSLVCKDVSGDYFNLYRRIGNTLLKSAKYFFCFGQVSAYKSSVFYYHYNKNII
jgi:hypothetical protein